MTLGGERTLAPRPPRDERGAGEEAMAIAAGEARRAGRLVWRGLDLSVVQGEFVAVLGPNGAGKSTLLHVILGLLPLSSGAARVLGDPPGRRNSEIGYLPQRRSFDPETRIRGRDVVRLGLDGARWGLPLPTWMSRSARAADRRVGEVIDLVGASAYADRPIGELSGGEQQRLLIAQALARGPRMLLLDEPLDGLDLPNQVAVAALLERISTAEGVTVVLVAHDVNPILAYLDRVVYFAGGRGVVGEPREVIRGEVLSRLYGAPVEVLETSDGRLVVVGTPEPPAIHASRHDH
jgi:zinc/manganese transport system ATP-binding protein